MRRFLTRSALVFLLLFLLLFGLLYGLLCVYAQRILFYGAYFGNTERCPAAETAAGAEPITFTTEDGTTLRGWLWNRGEGAPLVAVYGGNNMNVGAFVWLPLREPNTSFLLLNHRGYGGSEGTPSEKDVVADARAALRHYRAQLGNPQRVVLLGFSLGTGVATQVAATEQPSALILACPFDSALATACGHVPLLPYLLPMDHFRSDLAAPRVRCPVTIFMGEQDTIVPPARTMQLIPCFSGTTVQLLEVDRGHNDIFNHRDVQQELHDIMNPAAEPPAGGSAG